MKNRGLLHALTLIPTDLRRKGTYIAGLVTIAMIFDLFSLASFFPLIFLILDPASAGVQPIFKAIFPGKIPATVTMLQVLTGIILIFLIAKTILTTWITQHKARFAYSVAQRLAEQALNSFLFSPYKNYSSLDFAREMNRISNAPLTFANNIVIPFGTLLGELLVGGSLVVIAAIYQPGIFALLLATIAPLLILYGLVRRKIKRSSAAVKTAYPLLLKHTLQPIEALPEIRVLKKESFFLNRFNESFQNVSRVFARDHVIHTATGRVTELIAGICICVLIFFLSASDRSSSQIVITLSIYAAISFRMIPSINRVFTAVVQMKAHEHVAEELQRGFVPETVASNVPPVAFKERIEFENIRFQYGHHTILDNASITINKNERILFHGKSGAGKTTLLQLILGFHSPSSGKIKVDGRTLRELELIGFRSRMGYVPQNPYLLDASIAQNIAFGVADSQIDKTKIQHLLDQLDLAQWANSLPRGIETNIGEHGNKISGGQRQRIALARVLYHDCEILLMDEVTNQLDRNTEVEVMKVFDNPVFSNKTILLVTHRPELWKTFDTIYELKHGELNAGVLQSVN